MLKWQKSFTMKEWLSWLSVFFGFCSMFGVKLPVTHWSLVENGCEIHKTYLHDQKSCCKDNVSVCRVGQLNCCWPTIQWREVDVQLGQPAHTTRRDTETHTHTLKRPKMTRLTQAVQYFEKHSPGSGSAVWTYLRTRRTGGGLLLPVIITQSAAERHRGTCGLWLQRADEHQHRSGVQTNCSTVTLGFVRVK